MRLSLVFIFSTLVIGCSHMLYYPNQIQYIKAHELQPQPEDVFFTIEHAGKPVKLHAWHFLSPQPSHGQILFFHGNAENLSSHFRALFWLVDFGFDLFIFDYPGYGLSEGRPTPENTVTAGRAALKTLQQRNPDLPIITVGQSLGAVVSLQTLWQEQKQSSSPPVCLSLVESGFASYQGVARSIMANSFLTWPLQWLAPLLLSDRHAIGANVAKLSVPLIIMHSPHDPIVPFSQGQRLYRLASEPKEFWSIPHGGHISGFFGNPGEEFREKFVDRMKKHCEPL